MPRATIPSRPSVSTESPSTSCASACACAASAVGVRSLAGRFCRSRAALTDAAIVAASETSCSSCAASRASGALSTQRLQVLGGGVLPVRRGRAVAVEAVVGERRALHERRAHRRAALRRSLPAQRASRELQRACVRARRGHAGALGREVAALAQPHQQPPLAVRMGRPRMPWACRAPRPSRSAPPPRPAARLGASSPSKIPTATVSASVPAPGSLVAETSTFRAEPYLTR